MQPFPSPLPHLIPEAQAQHRAQIQARIQALIHGELRRRHVVCPETHLARAYEPMDEERDLWDSP